MPVLNQVAGTAPVAKAVPGCSDIPEFGENERPVDYAGRVGEWYAARVSDQQRKARGLFLTPVPVADFMSEQVKTVARKVRILDPAAGSGILCCAAVETLVSRRTKPNAIDLSAYEVDGDLIKPLWAVLDCLAGWCQKRHGVPVHFRIEATDFIIANADAVQSSRLFPSGSEEETFDVVIANPPTSRSPNPILGQWPFPR